VTIAAILLVYGAAVGTVGARMLSRASYVRVSRRHALRHSQTARLAGHPEPAPRRRHRLVALARISRRALPFLPLMRYAEAQVESLVELHADDAATQVRDPDSLATALVVLAAAASTPAPPSASAADADPSPALAAAGGTPVLGSAAPTRYSGYTGCYTRPNPSAARGPFSCEPWPPASWSGRWSWRWPQPCSR
jgi:hypothetical protein